MKKILLPALALLLASCGFHLKGTGVTSQPLPYQNWHVEGGAVMQKALENALRRADGHPVSEAESQITLRVVDFQKRRDIYTITRAAAVNEYLLAMTVKAQAFRNGEPSANRWKSRCTAPWTTPTAKSWANRKRKKPFGLKCALTPQIKSSAA